MLFRSTQYPSVSIDNLKFNLDNSGNPTVGALSGTVGSTYTFTDIHQSGGNWVLVANSGSATWSTVASYGFGATAITTAGQVVQATISDTSSGHWYSVRWMGSPTGTGYGTIVVEKLV